MVASQLRSHVFNKKELSSDTKLAIHRSIFRPTILYGSVSWVDCGYLVHDLEVSEMNVLRRIARVNRRDQWDNHNRNCNQGKSRGDISRRGGNGYPSSLVWPCAEDA